MFRCLRLAFVCAICFVAPGVAAPADYFRITVVDDQTGRGVPLVELRTVNDIRHYTDNNGVIAFLEPGLTDTEVFFHISSHGYEYPKDGFGFRGLKLRPTAHGSATIKLSRVNIAERLYRITGQGLYGDSLLVGTPVPIRQPALNGQVMGQDTVIATPYRGKVYWFWGDTERASYALGNFGASGAASEWTSRGGLDPAVGINLNYFVDASGFSKPMCPLPGQGLRWIEGLVTLQDTNGRERLYARVANVRDLSHVNDWHFMQFNDEREEFQSITRWDSQEGHDSAHPFRASVGGVEYIYWYPNWRVPATVEAHKELARYESFTCFKSAGPTPELDRDDQGRLRYAWRAGRERLYPGRLRKLISSGIIQTNEAWLGLHDFETGNVIAPGRGSVFWNEYRQRWVMLTSSAPGEIWFADADTPTGPWAYARRVVVHDRYNFYNPTQHPFFDQEKGRLIYFEGTFTDSFSAAPTRTPRYNYNQIMYRLDLADVRLTLPVPVYEVRTNGTAPRWMARERIEKEGGWKRVTEVAFFGLPQSSRANGLIPIFSALENGSARLQLTPASGDSTTKPEFFALPAKTTDETPREYRTPAVVPLYEFRDSRGRITYSTAVGTSNPGLTRAATPLCRVWSNPLSILPLDLDVKQVPLAKP